MDSTTHIEVSQLWGDSLLRVERFSRWRRLTVGPAASSDFAAAGDGPMVLVDRGAIHSDEGAVEITAETDLLVDVGEQTFRVRAVPEVRPLGGALFAHVDWLFVGVVLVGLVALLLGTIVTFLAILAFLLFRKLLAFLLAIVGLTAPMFLQIPAPPAPVPVVVASAHVAPLQPAPPAPPLFVRPTPKPVATMVPLPIGDILVPKRAAPKKSVAVDRLEMLKQLEDGEHFAVLGALSAREGDSGVLAMISGGGSGIGGLGTRGEGGGGTGIGVGGLGMRGVGGGSVDVLSGPKDEDDDEGVDEGVDGGVVGGVVGDVFGGTLTRETTIGMGSLTKEQISTTIRGHLAKIRHCYEKALLTDPSLDGRVVVSFRVDPTGRVQDAHVSSSTLHAIDACVVAEVSAMRFPEPVGGGTANVSYPFAFHAEP